jgi:DNA-binding CsgD family transcriptional regulator
MLNRVKNIINSGIHYAESYEESKRILLSNSLALIFIALSIPYSVLFYYLESTFMAIMVFPCVSFFSIPILLSYYGKKKYMGLGFISVVAIVIYFYSSVFGGDAGIQYMLFPLFASTCIMFSKSEKNIRTISMGVIVFIFMLLELTEYRFFFHEQLSSTTLKWIRLSIIANLFLILIFIVRFQLQIATHTKLNLSQFLNKYNLSNRESEILVHLCEGKSNKEIGDELFIEESTVKSHLKNIYKKLNVKSRSEVILFFLKR